MQVGDRHRGQEDPHRQAALVRDRVVVLRSAVHLSAKAGRLVLGVRGVVGRDVGDRVEVDLAYGVQPRDGVRVHRVRVREEERQREPARDLCGLLGIESGPDARVRQRRVAPRIAPDQLRRAADGRVHRPVLAAGHVPEDEPDRVDARERLRDECVRRQARRRVVEAKVDGVQLLPEHADRVHGAQYR